MTVLKIVQFAKDKVLLSALFVMLITFYMMDHVFRCVQMNTTYMGMFVNIYLRYPTVLRQLVYKNYKYINMFSANKDKCNDSIMGDYSMPVLKSLV